MEGFYEKKDSHIFKSYFHMKTVPPMNTLNQKILKVFIGGTDFIRKYELKRWKSFFQKSFYRFSLKFYYGQI